jgi:sec-independent protein translocase protein TatB
MSIYAATARPVQIVLTYLAGYIKCMLGVGGSEIIVIALIFLVIFGPGSLPKMARDVGRFVSEARRAVDDFKEEITSAADDDDEDDRPKRPKK